MSYKVEKKKIDSPEQLRINGEQPGCLCKKVKLISEGVHYVDAIRDYKEQQKEADDQS